jgi:hypothetical protein
MIVNWSLVLWPLGIAVAAGLLLISHPFWRNPSVATDKKWQDRDLRGRAIAGMVTGVLIAAVAFFVQYFSGRSSH